jgi:hypothetical protein
MKKIKQFSLKAMLLTIVAVLTIGFTGCSDELSGDQTQGKPGYLTLNLKTLKPKQTKTATDLSLDYQTIIDLNVFIFRGDDLILRKYITTQDDGTTALADITNTVNIRVGELAITDSVVVVANYGSPIDVSTKSALQEETIPTIGDFSSTGLCMTGIGSIAIGTGFTYTSEVKVAPVVSKISVKWIASGDADYYNITGIYIVNAIDHTKLPIVLERGVNRGITSLLTPTPKTASSGFAVASSEIARDYDIYAHTVPATAGILSDVNASGLDNLQTYSYYVGENYHADVPTTRNDGELFTTNTSNANTIILIEATPKTVGEGAPAWIANGGVKYYTYDLSAGLVSSTPSDPTSPNIASGVAEDGFSTRRKTNYIVNFNLQNVGTSYPFEHISTLAVTVIANPWDVSTNGVTF